MPVTYVFYKKLISTWYEKGFADAVEEAANLKCNEAPIGVIFLAKQLLKVVNGFGKLRNFIYPHMRVSRLNRY